MRNPASLWASPVWYRRVYDGIIASCCVLPPIWAFRMLASAVRFSFVGYVVLLSVAVGCNRDRGEGSKSGQTLDRIVAEPLQVLPASSLAKVSYAKRSSWVQTRQAVKAPAGTEKIDLRYDVLRQGDRSVQFSADQNMVFSRSAALPTGQAKQLEQSLFVPPSPDLGAFGGDSFRASLPVKVDIVDRSFGSSLLQQTERIQILNEYQTCFVILADHVERHAFWNRSNVVRWPAGFSSPISTIPFQCIYVSSDDAKSSLPSQFYGWLNTSTICWNETSADDLTEQQQQAIVDWLHAGGRLIINGPTSIDGLANSFLQGYLPLEKLVSNDSQAGDLTETLNSFAVAKSTYEFTLDGGATLENPEELEDRPPVNEKLKASAIVSNLCAGDLANEASWVQGCHGLLAERAVGAGRVCMSTFDLAGQELTIWPSYGSFLNATVFRLPGRTWAINGDERYSFYNEQMTGREQLLSSFSNLTLLSRREPHRNTPKSTRSDYSFPGDGQTVSQSWNGTNGETRWTDGAWFSQIALDSLRQISGIKVPPVNYLLKLLTVYLAILVPANWIVFRIIGRLEWAWFTIPVIALVGAGIIARMLQVEIGFARSQNSVSLLQTQAGYPRGILTQYVSLYSSLSTRFSVSLPDQNGVVSPVGSLGVSDKKIEYRAFDDQGSGIRSLPIRSHTTSTFHAEEVVSMNGDFDIQIDDARRKQIVNNTRLALRDTVLLVTSSDRQELFWVGDVGASDTIDVDEAEAFQFAQLGERLRKSFDQRERNRQGPATGEESVSMDRQDLAIVNAITGFALMPAHPRTEATILAWTENDISTLRISPAASQISGRTVVCCQRFKSAYAPPEQDRNLPPRIFESDDWNDSSNFDENVD